MAIVNTILGASMGGLSVLVLTKVIIIIQKLEVEVGLKSQFIMQNILGQFLWHRVGDGKWSFLMTLNGALAGMVGDVTNLLCFVFILMIMIIMDMI